MTTRISIAGGSAQRELDKEIPKGRHTALGAAGLALVVLALAVAAIVLSPEPAQACLFPGIPC